MNSRQKNVDIDMLCILLLIFTIGWAAGVVTYSIYDNFELNVTRASE